MREGGFTLARFLVLSLELRRSCGRSRTCICRMKVKQNLWHTWFHNFAQQKLVVIELRGKISASYYYCCYCLQPGKGRLPIGDELSRQIENKSFIHRCRLLKWAINVRLMVMCVRLGEEMAFGTYFWWVIAFIILQSVRCQDYLDLAKSWIDLNSRTLLVGFYF